MARIIETFLDLVLTPGVNVTIVRLYKGADYVGEIKSARSNVAITPFINGKGAHVQFVNSGKNVKLQMLYDEKTRNLVARMPLSAIAKSGMNAGTFRAAVGKVAQGFAQVAATVVASAIVLTASAAIINVDDHADQARMAGFSQTGTAYIITHLDPNFDLDAE